MSIQTAQIIYAYCVLEIASTFFDLLNQFWNIGLKINQQIGRFYKLQHGFKNLTVTLIVAWRHVSSLSKISSKDISIFVDGPILNDRSCTLANLIHLSKPAVEKVDLQMESPLSHV